MQEAFALIQDDIDKVEVGIKEAVATEVTLISNVGEYLLESGGKRFRPLALLLSAKICGFDGDERIALAMVVEFIHTATLLHDDVVDNADLRRGKASANTVWGNGSSVLVGDYLLAKAMTIAVGQGNLDIIRVLSEATSRMAEGEVRQLINYSDIETTEETYLSVITDKTAVLFAAACKIPTLLAGVNGDRRVALERFGLDLGIAFQLIDDCLDYTSKNEELGKTIGNDLREGKVTLPLIKAFSLATADEKEILRAAIEDSDKKESVIKAGGLKENTANNNTDLEKVFAIINKYEGIDYTMNEARKRIESAKTALEIFAPNTERAALTAMADFAINRTN
ncbi:MAG: polyprenyl synthetase family protein [Deltaproteobacteria bacterium]|nr:polyprenyl synthetase family protein [Deltaproteobacteria bacterium]